MFQRELENELRQAAADYPIVTLTGPRQAGKTTLVRSTFPEKPYVNLEALDTQELATVDPRAFLLKYPQGAIFDEIQRVPTLLSYIQVTVDEQDKKGLFILTGSHQIELHQAISQSLAGRTALLHLLPLSIAELARANIRTSIDTLLLQGGYPRIYNDALNPTKAYRNYFQTYIERDLRQIIQVKDLSQFQRFVKILAGRVGQLLNFESLGSEIGISSHTIKAWLSILEASYIIFRLQPYHENFGKRLIKSSKLYFTDVGLLSFLLGIETAEQLARDPLRGHLVENLFILELLKHRLNRGQEPRLYFFRDIHGHEIDLIYHAGTDLIPIEIKSAQTFNSSFLKNLSYFKKLIGERFRKGFIIYTGETNQSLHEVELVKYQDAANLIFEG